MARSPCRRASRGALTRLVPRSVSCRHAFTALFETFSNARWGRAGKGRVVGYHTIAFPRAPPERPPRLAAPDPHPAPGSLVFSHSLDTPAASKHGPYRMAWVSIPPDHHFVCARRVRHSRLGCTMMWRRIPTGARSYSTLRPSFQPSERPHACCGKKEQSGARDEHGTFTMSPSFTRCTDETRPQFSIVSSRVRSTL